MENQNLSAFPIPLWLGWVIEIAGWGTQGIFNFMENPAIEIIIGLLCVGCVYVGYKHKQAATPPFLGIRSLSAGNLIYSSAVAAIWMFGWGSGFFGDFFFKFETSP